MGTIFLFANIKSGFYHLGDSSSNVLNKINILLQVLGPGNFWRCAFIYPQSCTIFIYAKKKTERQTDKQFKLNCYKKKEKEKEEKEKKKKKKKKKAKKKAKTKTKKKTK